MSLRHQYNGVQEYARLALVLLLAMLAGTSGATIQVPYEQFGRVHCRYDNAVRNAPDPAPDDPKMIELLFEHVSPEAAVTILQSLPVPETGEVRLQGTERLEMPGVGDWTFRFRVKWDDGTLTLLEQKQVTLQERFAGTLLLDEVLDNTSGDSALCGGVSVPKDLSLNLGGQKITGSSTISVWGDLLLDGCTFVDTSIIYRKQILLSAPPSARYAFAVNGSGISGGENLTVSSGGASVSLSSIKNLTLDLSNGAGTFNVSGCDLVFGSAWDLLAGGVTTSFSDCRFANTTLNIRNGDDHRFLGSSNKFSDLYVSLRGATGKALFEDSIFNGFLTISGNKESDCQFKGCEFASAITLQDRLPVHFEANMLRDWVLVYGGDDWATSTVPGPVFVNNDFLGKDAFYILTQYSQEPVSPIQIGTNYYGDADGPVFLYWNAGYPSNRFLGGRGARVVGLYDPAADPKKPGPLLVFAQPAPKGTWTSFSSRKKLPNIWLVNNLLGQGTVSHSASASLMLAGTEFFLSLDVACNVPGVDDARFFVEMNGTEYESTNSRQRITRGLDAYTPRQVANAASTINFFLPVPSEGFTSLKVYLDTTGLSGFEEAGSKTLMIDMTRMMTRLIKKDARRMAIIVQPIKLFLLGYITTPAPNGTAFVSELDPYFRTMMPVRRRDVLMVPQPPLPFTGVVSNVPWIGTYTLANSLATWLQATKSTANLINSAFGTQPIDFVIGVVPPGGLGEGIDGANLALRRSVLLVDQAKPSAAFHEMGHAVGLYPTEQYDMFPPSGLATEGCSIFKKEDAYAIMFFGDQGRLMHLPSPSDPWYVDMGFMDIMSAVDRGIWPTASTWDKFFTAFRSQLGTSVGKANAQSSILPSGMRALSMQGAVRLVSGTDYYEFVPGSLSTYPMAGVSQNYFIAQPPPAGIEDKYEFSGYDAGGNRLDYDAFRLLPTSGEHEAVDLWWATFLIANSSVVRFQITRSSDGAVIFEHRPDGPLGVSISEPTGGSLLTGDVTLRWQTTHSRKSFSKTDVPISHMVYISEDNGASWRLLHPFLAEQEVVIPSDLIPTTNQLALRVDATDGLQVATAQVLGLRVPNHPPHVTIASPLDGDFAEPDTAWTLQAVAWDVDEQEALDGSWRSDRDGALGPGNTLRGVVLSPGSHVLTFEAADNQSAVGSASVTVRVGAPATGVDLSLAEDALTLSPPGSNPHVSQAVTRVRPGRVHAFSLRFRNQGVAGEATLRLYRVHSDSTEELLAEETLELAPFEETQIGAEFVPTGEGEFQFRGTVEGLTFTDPDTTNNSRTWAYQSTLGVVWVIQ